MLYYKQVLKEGSRGRKVLGLIYVSKALESSKEVKALELPYEERFKYENLYNRAMLILRAQGRSLATTFMHIRRVVWTNSEAIPTACITVTRGRPLIYVNVNFINTLKDKAPVSLPEDLFLAGILSHELMHFLFRHGSKINLKRLKNKTIANLTFDIFINHLLKKINLHHFAEVYYPSEVDEAMFFMLNPSVRDSGKHKSMYQKINTIQASLEEIEAYLLKHMPKNMTEEQVISILIGSHGEQEGEGESGEGSASGESFSPDESPSGEDGLSEEARKELENVVREFFTKGDTSLNKSASKVGDYFDEHLQIPAKKNKDFSDFARQALIKSVRGEIMAAVGRYRGPNQIPTYHIQNNRHKLMQAAAGATPLWWNKSYKREYGKLRVYIDMSGSMDELKEMIVSIILGLEKSWEVEPFIFTTVITPTNKKELREGNFRSGGTNFNAVFDHIREDKQGINKVVMITDGYDSGLSSANIELLENKSFDLFVVYTKDHSKGCLEKYTKQYWIIN